MYTERVPARVTNFDQFCEILRSYRPAFRAGFVAAVCLLLLTVFSFVNVERGSDAYIVSIVNSVIIGFFLVGLGTVYVLCDLGRNG
jgi:hypothetical protein